MDNTESNWPFFYLNMEKKIISIPDWSISGINPEFLLKVEKTFYLN